jgi:hypothetical protein
MSLCKQRTFITAEQKLCVLSPSTQSIFASNTPLNVFQRIFCVCFHRVFVVVVVVVVVHRVFRDATASNETKVEALRKALDTHTGIIKEAANGQGVERHLFALRCLAERMVRGC